MTEHPEGVNVWTAAEKIHIAGCKSCQKQTYFQEIMKFLSQFPLNRTLEKNTFHKNLYSEHEIKVRKPLITITVQTHPSIYEK